MERRTGDSRNEVGLSPGGIVMQADLEIGSFAGDSSLYLAPPPPAPPPPPPPPRAPASEAASEKGPRGFGSALGNRNSCASESSGGGGGGDSIGRDF